MINRILIVCTGNICRSPVAMALLNHKLATGVLHNSCLVDSAGFYAANAKASNDATEVMKLYKTIKPASKNIQEILVAQPSLPFTTHVTAALNY